MGGMGLEGFGGDDYGDDFKGLDSYDSFMGGFGFEGYGSDD